MSAPRTASDCSHCEPHTWMFTSTTSSYATARPRKLVRHIEGSPLISGPVVPHHSYLITKISHAETTRGVSRAENGRCPRLVRESPLRYGHARDRFTGSAGYIAVGALERPPKMKTSTAHERRVIHPG